MNQKIVITRQILVAVILMFSAAAFVSCDKYVWDPPKIDDTIPVSFQNEILPIFTGNNCVGCHGGSLDPDLRPANAYDALINGGYVIPNHPETSDLYNHLLTSPHNTRCTDVERQKISAWIKQGAINDNITK